MKEIFQLTYYILAVIGIASGLLITILLLLQKKGGLQSNKRLAILFLSITMLLLPHLIMIKFKIGATYEHITLVYLVYVMAVASIGPGLYLYFRSLTKKTLGFKALSLLHYIPLVLIIAFWIIFIKNHDPIWDPLHFIILGQFTVYMILSTVLYIRLLRKPKQNKEAYSIGDIIWVSILFFTVVFIWFIHFNVQVRLIPGLIHKLQAIVLTCLLYFVLISEFFNNRIGKLHQYYNKYSYSRLTNEESEKYLTEIQNYIIQEDRYKEPNITLPKLARDLKISQNIISQVINEQLKLNFCDFLNSYRIEAAKKMLADPKSQHLTIAGIAYDCGFNSLSAFNKAFNKFAGITPSKYRLKNLA
jgi:AraC-like DNA-binding protein